jgi:signal transduction histidine kinase
VHPLATPCLAMSAIAAYLGLYHLTLALRRAQAREHLPFALLCASVSAYDIFCVGLYNATSLAQGVFWQRLQLQTVLVIAVATVWFIGRLTGTEKAKANRRFIAWFMILAPFTLIEAGGLTVSESTPALKQISWAGRPLITYHESDVGPISLLVILSAFIAYVYVVIVLFRTYRIQRARRILAILIGNLCYFIGVVNDSLIAAGAYSFVYVSEYGFMVLIIAMAYVLLCKFVELQADVEALNVNLERTVQLRTAALQRSLEQQRAMQVQLVAASRRSGMADVATEVLHNVGNALNSVNVSVDLLQRSVEHSRLPGLTKVVGMISEHASDLPGYFADSRRAKLVPEYLAASTATLEEERASLAGDLRLLRQHVEQINVIIATQRSYVGAPTVSERTSLAAVIDDALDASAARHDSRSDVQLERAYEPVPDIDVDRHKLLQILSSLLDNAWEALEDATAERRIRVQLRGVGDRVAIDVEDSGCGIPAENLTRIFHHGFTTRKARLGFGLHASGCAAGELGGTLVANSDGPGRGARFTLTLPLRLAASSYDASPNTASAVAGVK